MFYRGLFLFAFGLVVTTPGQADVLRLNKAIAYALQNNPELIAQHEQTLGARSNTKVAKSARLPKLGASYSARSSNNPLDAFADKLNTRQVTTPDFEPSRLNDPGTSTLYEAKIFMTIPVYTGGGTSARIQQAIKNETAARLAYEWMQQRIIFLTLQAYRQTQAAEKKLVVAKNAVQAANAHANTTAALVRARRTITSDKLTAEVSRTAIKSQRERARTLVKHAHYRLKRIMGLPLEMAIEVSPLTMANAVTLDSGTLADLERTALSRRKDLLAMVARHKAAQSLIRVRRAALKPHFSITASNHWYDDEPSVDNSSWRIMGTLSTSLYSGGRNRNSIAAATHNARSLGRRVHGLKQTVRNQVRQNYDNVMESSARIRNARDNVTKARRNVFLIKRRYGQGRTLLIDLLQAERMLVAAQNEEINATLKFYVSTAALRLSQGNSPVQSNLIHE